MIKKVAAGLKKEKLSSTIILCRPRKNNFEILMVKRKSSMSFSNALVFPGGVLDDADSDPRWSQLSDYPSEEIPETSYSQKIDLKTLKITGIRETWEEVGVLLANGQIPRTKNGSEFLDACLSENCKPDLENLHYFTRIITPLKVPSRFDTVFFLANVEEDRQVYLDTNESDFYFWGEPKEIIDKYLQKEILLWPPQCVVLTILAGLQSINQAINYTRTVRKIPMLPEISENGLFFMPGDHRNSYTPDYLKTQNAVNMMIMGKSEISIQTSPEAQNYITAPSAKL